MALVDVTFSKYIHQVPKPKKLSMRFRNYDWFCVFALVVPHASSTSSSSLLNRRITASRTLFLLSSTPSQNVLDSDCPCLSPPSVCVRESVSPRDTSGSYTSDDPSSECAPSRLEVSYCKTSRFNWEFSVLNWMVLNTQVRTWWRCAYVIVMIPPYIVRQLVNENPPHIAIQSEAIVSVRSESELDCLTRIDVQS